MMRSGVEYLLDTLMLVLVLAAGLPVLLFACNVFLYDLNFGFNTLQDKSVMATPAQERDLLADDALLTRSHIIMMSSVDDKTSLTATRTVDMEGIGAHTYVLTPASKLEKGTLIKNAGLWYKTAVGALPGVASMNARQYYLNIRLDGSITFSNARREVQ